MSIADSFDAKITLIWVVSPKTQTVLVYGSNESVRRLCETDDLTADPLISGVRVRVGDLFPNPLGVESDELETETQDQPT